MKFTPAISVLAVSVLASMTMAAPLPTIPAVASSSAASTHLTGPSASPASTSYLLQNRSGATKMVTARSTSSSSSLPSKIQDAVILQTRDTTTHANMVEPRSSPSFSSSSAAASTDSDLRARTNNAAAPAASINQHITTPDVNSRMG
ncbi:hypothetical protein DFS34DRAFT_597202 [Phlyctochytrium arcticum]|nr:hypothetical protein DFS34DRAFT_597202 [Phlyctochytrium arcticum]